MQNLTPGPTSETVYAAGEFNTVNGTTAKGVVLLSTVTGQQVSGFQPAALDGVVYGVRLSPDHTHLFIGGSFTKVAGATHQGLAALDPSTGQLQGSYLTVQLTGHHNCTPGTTQACGRVGPRKIAVSPDGKRMMVIGNFKYADGSLRGQIAMIDPGTSSASLDQNWATLAYTSPCIAAAFDTYMSGVDFSPDGSYFAVGATGGSGTNTDGTNSSCDSVARFPTVAPPGTASDVRPTWLDYTGKDTIGSVAVAGDAIYAGGHQRWLNNANGHDTPGQGAVPRPGLAALDPQNGVPFSWNPGRNPRGIGAYALLVTADGLYVGSDTKYIGNHKYLRERIALFPLAGGTIPPPNSTPQLPGNVYLAGGLTAGQDTLAYRPFDGSTAGTTTTADPGGIAWSQVRGAFLVDGTLFYGMANGTFNKRTFDGTTFGSATSIDPYDDPLWSSVTTGSGPAGQTYRGTKPTLYGQMSTVTGMFYNGGMLYYTLSGSATLYGRYFAPESGIIGAQVFSFAGDSNLSNAAGMFYSGGQIYYASQPSGALRRVAFTGGGLGSDVIANSLDWQSRGLFLDDATPGQNQPPTAVISDSCSQLSCSFDGSGSSDRDGQVKSYAWDFGDRSTGTGSSVQHTYAADGTYTVTLTVTDDQAGTGSTTAQVSPATTQGSQISFVGRSSTNGNRANQTVNIPAGTSAGDGLVLISTSATSTSPAAPMGWPLVKTLSNVSMTTTVWQRVATAEDVAGSTVNVGYGSIHQGSVELLDYHGTDATTPVSSTTGAAADTATTANHTTPVVDAAAGSWGISYWADKSSTTTGWHPPSGPTSRGTNIGSGSGYITDLVADAGPVSGSYGGLTATTEPQGAPKAEQWTVVLAPGT